MYYRGNFKKDCIKEKIESEFWGEKPAFCIHILTLRAAEYSLIKALPEVQEATLQLSTAGIFCTGVWKRNHSNLCFEKIVRLREKRLFPTENLIQLINKKPQNSVLDFSIVYMKKLWNTSIGSHLVNKTDKCYLLCKIHLLGEKYRRIMAFRGHIIQMS